MNSRSTLRFETSAPASAGRIRSGSSKPFEHGLRTFGEAFAFFIQLPQNFEARLFLRDRAFDPVRVLLRLGQRFLLRLQMLLGRAHFIEKILNRLLFGLVRVPRLIECTLRIVAGLCAETNFGREIGDTRKGGIATVLRAGNFVA